MSDQEKAQASEQARNDDLRSSSTNPASAWGTELIAATCEHCDWGFLLPSEASDTVCPHCFQGKLSAIGEAFEGLPYIYPPELIVPFSASSDGIAGTLRNFSRSIPFAPKDLRAENLQARLQRIFIPMWLVDVDVRASWQSEVGFDYDVVSFRDEFADRQGGWSEQRVTETRIRWEPRVGKLARTYPNTPAPALEKHAQLVGKLGAHALDSAQSYHASSIQDAYARLPNRAPEDAWSDAMLVLRSLAAEECRQAAEAKHQRDFRWSPEYSNQHWTQVLLPIYTTHYFDDEKQPQPVLIHGQTGKIQGARRASIQRARNASLLMFGLASILGFPSLLASVLPILPNEFRALAGCPLALSLLLGILSIIPIAVAWQFNRRRRIENQRL
ncbi:MAG TPA: hypothetical protein G4O08_04715 [Anaerolineae bacterium]|nr:hypothetical protein [Anaerolineae bacterium]